MRKSNSLKAAFGWMLIAFVCAFVGVSLVSCDKDDFTGHDNSGNAAMSITVKPDTTKPGPEPVFRNDTVPAFRNDSVIVTIDYYKNDTIIDVKNYGVPVMASISREFDKLQTTEARLANLDFTFGEVSSSTNGKNQVVGKQSIQDGDGQNYNGQTTSGKIFDIYAELVTFKKTSLKNTDREPSANEAKLVNTNIAWVPVVRIVNAPNLAGKEFELTTNNTEHLRYILKNAPELLKTDTTMVRRPDVWFTSWDLIIEETWSNDSVAEKKKTIRTNASVEPITLEDKFVSSFDYSYTNNDLSWGAWKAIQSNDSSISLEEQEGFKLGNASNGYSDDAFDTKYVAKRQRATVLFGGFKWNIPAEDVTLSTTRKVFVEQTSDLDGYSMVKFVNDEIARYNNANEQTLTESCKLYMKIQTIDLDKIEFTGTKVHTEGMAKIDGSVIPVYSDGSKGGAIAFKFEKAESWVWLKDSVIAENVNFVMEETGTLKLKGSETKTAKTFATDNENITIKCNQYDADFQTTVKIDGEVKVTTWHGTWYEDFKVCYEGKEVSLTKSSYSVKNQNDKLTKDEARSNATLETWKYSVDGIFNIDEDSRSAYGYGRITKAIAEEVVTEYWDKFSFETDAHEYEDRVEYFLKWIREYNTGKKTSTDVKIVLKRNAEGSTYTITVEDPEREIGQQSESSSILARTESSSDIVINYDWKTSVFELPNYFDGSTITKSDVATFVDPTNVKVTKKNAKGEEVTISLPSFEHELTSTVSDLQMVSETEELIEYTYTRTWSWASSQCTSTAKSYGNINKVPEYGGGEPDFDIEVGKIIATVSRPSNRDAADITAYTYLLVSKDGTKCLPLGFYNGVITVDEKNGIVDYKAGMNSACYVKDENKVVATTASLASGIIKYKDANGNMVDGGMFLTWQGAGFNDRGNDYLNHTGKYAPKAEKKGNVYVVTFEGTSVSYTFRGWDVK